MLNTELDRIWPVSGAMPFNDPKKDDLNKIHLELSNVLAVMKPDLTSLS